MHYPKHSIPALIAAVLLASGPSQARTDFEIQGEYVGKLRSAAGAESDIAAQIVAERDGIFRVVFFPGGLPGAGWTGAGKSEAEAEMSGGFARLIGEYTGTIDGDSLNAAKSPDATFALAKRERISPTMGLKPPPEATILFDGSSIVAWTNASMDSAGNFAPLEREATTLKRFSDFSLHLEYRVPFLPHLVGQSRANSGLRLITDKVIFAEMQILDSFGGEPGTEDCGGIEGRFPPLVMAAFPPMAWQTLDVQMTSPPPTDTTDVGGAKLTIWHNGIMIHPGRKMDYWGSWVTIGLQNLSAPGAFRNIWVVEGNDAYPFPGVGIRPDRSARMDAGRSRFTRPAGNSVRLHGPEGWYRADGAKAGGPEGF